MLAFVALLLIALVGGAGAYWAYKKYRQKQNQEFRLEGKMPFQVKPGALVEDVKKEILSDEVLDQVIEKHQLIEVWALADNEAARQRINEKFKVIIDGTEVKVTYQGKDKELTREILHSIANGFIEKARKRQALPVGR